MSSKESTLQSEKKAIKHKSPALATVDMDTPVAAPLPATQVNAPQGVVQRATQKPASLTPPDLLYLQRTIGNRAVHQMLSEAKPAQTAQRTPAASPSTPPRIDIKSTAAPVIQRAVHSLVLPMMDGSAKTVYYSTYDSETHFDDPKEAWAHDGKLAGAREDFDPHNRFPTNYSYYMVESRNVMPLTKQGPHTLSHSATAFRLNKRLQEPGGLKKVWKNQVLSKSKFAKMLSEEAPSTFTPLQEARMITDYDLLFDRAEALMDADPDTYTAEKHELIMRLMQLHPYTAYGKGKMGRGALKHKGERKEAKFKSAFDKKAKFNNMKNFEEFSNKRKELFSDAEESESEEEEAPKKKPTKRRKRF